MLVVLSVLLQFCLHHDFLFVQCMMLQSFSQFELNSLTIQSRTVPIVGSNALMSFSFLLQGQLQWSTVSCWLGVGVRLQYLLLAVSDVLLLIITYGFIFMLLKVLLHAGVLRQQTHWNIPIDSVSLPHSLRIGYSASCE